MVTSRQFTRGVVRTVKAIDRDAKRSARRRQDAERAAIKVEALEAAADAAQQYQALIDALFGAHRVAPRTKTWAQAATATPPTPPTRSSANEANARLDADDYAPGWLARKLGGEARKRQALENAVHEGRRLDDQTHRRALKAHEDRVAEIEAARLVVEGDPAALADALGAHSGLGELPFSVEGLSLKFRDERVIAVVDGLDIEDMPEQSVTLLQSGKASVKPIPHSKALEMHRDNILSSALRVANEILSTIPIVAVEVVMRTDVLDRSTGHIEEALVLHVRVTLQALGPLNLQRADPLPLMERLGGHFEWNKKDGFRPLNPASFGVED